VGTNEYRLGNGGFAAQLGCKQSNYGNGLLYNLPPEAGDGWIVDIQPASGLFVTTARFTLLQPITRVYDIAPMGMWLCLLEYGEITIIEKGKKARRLQKGIHLLTHRGQPVKISFNTAEPIHYTSVLVFDDFVTTYVKDRPFEQPFTLKDTLTWRSPQYNTPELVMVLQQIKYAVWDAVVPRVYYEGKVIEILILILRNVQQEGYWRKLEGGGVRLSYENKIDVLLVKDELDRNLLNPPTIKQLTGIAKMGTTKLRQCFKLCYGVSISDYVQQEKMKQAMRLLPHDDMSICSIARAMGYKSASKFAAAFKKVHNITPRDFRKSFMG